MTPDAAERMRVYQEGQRSARNKDAKCPYLASNWRSKTWFKGRVAATEYNNKMELLVEEEDRQNTESEE